MYSRVSQGLSPLVSSRLLEPLVLPDLAWSIGKHCSIATCVLCNLFGGTEAPKANYRRLLTSRHALLCGQSELVTAGLPCLPASLRKTAYGRQPTERIGQKGKSGNCMCFLPFDFVCLVHAGGAAGGASWPVVAVEGVEALVSASRAVRFVLSSLVGWLSRWVHYYKQVLLCILCLEGRRPSCGAVDCLGHGRFFFCSILFGCCTFGKSPATFACAAVCSRSFYCTKYVL